MICNCSMAGTKACENCNSGIYDGLQAYTRYPTGLQHGRNERGQEKYRKKPVIIEAYRTNEDKIIHTLEGDMLAKKGDYIITGVHGEEYPCKPDIFHETYEPVYEDSLKQ